MWLVRAFRATRFDIRNPFGYAVEELLVESPCACEF
jgi:hypothetical protein